MNRRRLLVALVALASAWPVLARAEDQPIEVEVVDAMNKVFGVHPGFRTVHAKGMVVEGSFRGTPDGAALSSVPL